MFEIIVSERSEKELNEIIDYYESLNLNNVIQNFFSNYDEIIISLELFPFFELKYNDYRTIPFNDFPFLMFFKIFEDIKIVQIISIIHTSKDPDNYPS